MWRYGHLLEIVQIAKSAREEEVISDLSLTIGDKGVFGILSVDSTARTALAELICGCENTDGGEIRINGEVMSRSALGLKRKVRLVPTCLELDSAVTSVEHLDFVGAALGVDPDKRYRQIKEALELLGIEDAQNKPFSLLNASQRLRLAIAASLIGNPEIIVMDDPFRRVEGKAQEEIYGIVAMLGKIKTVVLLSHTPLEVKKLCENAAVMCGGRIALSGNIADIEAKINSTRELHISVRGDWDKIQPVIEETDKVVSVKLVSTDKNNVNAIVVEHLPNNKMKDELFAALSQINAPMLSVKAVVLTFEDVFYSLTDKDKKRIDAARAAAEEKEAAKRAKRDKRDSKKAGGDKK